jgi:methylated-DNA-protein-cysteine methyltransferase related protein
MFQVVRRTADGWDHVYRLVKRIPRGRVLTYADVARALRLPGGARSAGRAMAATPSGQGIPWHRVVGAGGKLLIREPYASLQRKLLESEKVQMTERRVNMKLHHWTVGRKRPARSSALRSTTRTSLGDQP